MELDSAVSARSSGSLRSWYLIRPSYYTKVEKRSTEDSSGGNVFLSLQGGLIPRKNALFSSWVRAAIEKKRQG